MDVNQVVPTRSRASGTGLRPEIARMAVMKLPAGLTRGLYPFISVLVVVFAANAWGARASGPGHDDDFKWEEAGKEVSNLPYTQSFIDSLHAAYDVTRPEKPLRVIPRSPFFKNETLVYDIGWGPFKAGYVILTAEPDPKRRIVRLGGKALSNGFISAFYRMRDYVISTIDDRGLYPLFFEQHLREGKRYKSDGWIVYDHERHKIHVKERQPKTLDAMPFVNDYLSVLYLVRTMKFAPGDTFTLPLYADKKVHRLFMTCKERKTLRIDDDTVPCLLLEPKLVGDKGAFNKKDRLQVWLSDDDEKVPMLIKSKINIGSISARLVRSKPAGATPGTGPAETGGGGGTGVSAPDSSGIPATTGGAVPVAPDSFPASPDSGGSLRTADSLPASPDSADTLKTPAPD